DVVQLELVGETKSLATELHGTVTPVCEHVVARRFAQDRGLYRRRRHPRHECRGIVHMLAHAVPAAFHPGDLREKERRLGGTLAVTGGQEVLPRLLNLLSALLGPEPPHLA